MIDNKKVIKLLDQAFAKGTSSHSFQGKKVLIAKVQNNILSLEHREKIILIYKRKHGILHWDCNNIDELDILNTCLTYFGDINFKFKPGASAWSKRVIRLTDKQGYEYSTSMQKNGIN